MQQIAPCYRSFCKVTLYIPDSSLPFLFVCVWNLKSIMDEQLEPIYNSSVPIQNIALKTSRERWTIETGGERGSGRPVLAAWHDDLYIKWERSVWKVTGLVSNFYSIPNNNSKQSPSRLMHFPMRFFYHSSMHSGKDSSGISLSSIVTAILLIFILLERVSLMISLSLKKKKLLGARSKE